MDHLWVSDSHNPAKEKAVEAARKMQASIIDAANKDDRDPPKYALKELIGKGSCGLVYKGKDVSTAGLVAVKIVDMEKRDITSPYDIDSYSEYSKEVNALKLLDKNKARNIIHVIETLSVGKTMWIITEYCGGGSVATLMKPTAPHGLEEKWIIPILREVAEAIRWVHEVGIIHRDIKCANVLVTEQGEVKLSDFGVAGILETNIEKRSSFIGTPHWMAPECFDNNPSYGKEVDVWSFGSLVYEIATGLPPNVNSGIASDNLGFYLRSNTPRLEGDNFSKELRSLVAYCLELHPSSRPTIDQVQRHPYLYNSHSFYPTVNLSKLVKAYVLWERRGNGRKSLVMPSDATESMGKVETDEWVFSTSSSFGKQSTFKGTGQNIQERNRQQNEVNEPFLSKPSGHERSHRRHNRPSPTQRLAPHQSPLEKAFDPPTLSNYGGNSQSYHSPSSQYSGSNNSLRNDNTRYTVQHSLGNGEVSGLVVPQDSARLGIKDLLEKSPTWPNEGNNHCSTMASHKTSIRSETDSTAYKHTLDWKFPSAQKAAEIKSAEAPFDGVFPPPSGESHLYGFPPLIHYSTDPTGNQLRSCAAPSSSDWLSMRQSLIDLDLSTPQFDSPLSSIANPDQGSSTPVSLFELGSPILQAERRIREPSLYVDNGSISPLNLSSGNMVNSPRTSSAPKNFQPSSLFEVEDVSKSSETASTAMPAEPRRQVRTAPYLSALPSPPSATVLSGEASKEEVANEMSRLFDGMAEELGTFHRIYNSPAVLAHKMTVKDDASKKPRKD